MSTGTDPGRQEAAAHELRQGQLVLTSDPEEALAHFVRAERLAPDNLDILLSLARVQVRLQKYSDAVGVLERYTQLKPEPDSEVLGGLALSYRHLRQYDRAKMLAEKALALRPDHRTAREVLADALMAEKAWAQGLAELNKLTSALSDAALARVSFKAAWCLFQLEQYHQAFDIAATLIENGYETEPLQKLYEAAEGHVKTEIEDQLKHMNFLQRFFLRIVDKPVLNIFMESRRGMDALRKQHVSQGKALAAAKEAAHDFERRHAEAERISKTDTLTGLPNRRCLEDDWIPKLGAGPVAIISCDLDKFKLINDTHGHGGGDVALCKFADLAAEAFRHPDGNFFRVGGEEFVGLIYGGEDQAMRMTESFRSEIERRGAAELAKEGKLGLKEIIVDKLRARGESNLAPTGWRLKVWDEETQALKDRTMTASIGLAMYPADGATFQEVFKKADDASYAAKATGRNKLVRWKLGMESEAPKAPAAPAPAAATKKSGQRGKAVPAGDQAPAEEEDGHDLPSFSQVLGEPAAAGNGQD